MGNVRERHLEDTPQRMVGRDGMIRFGTFRRPFEDPNILDAPLAPWGPVPPAFRRVRLKEWQHFGLLTPEKYFGMVIFDAKFMGVSFIYSFDRERKTLVEHARQGAGGAAQVARQLYRDECEFRARGYRLHFLNRLEEGYHLLRFEVEARKGKPAMRGEFRLEEDLDRLQPLVQVSPVKPWRPLYTHKAALPASGWAEVGGERLELDPARDIALMDEQKTYYPYFSFWEWSTGAARDRQGRIVAFNLCRNMIKDDEWANENCLWVDGVISLLSAARFDFDKTDLMRPWSIRTTDNRVELAFKPLGERAQRINLGLIRSDFHQPFGLYEGSLVDDAGTRHALRDSFGLAEHHLTRY